MPIAAVEIEVSLQAYEQQTREGGHWQILSSPRDAYFVLPVLVAATCAELGIAIVAYSYAALLSPSSLLPHPQQPSWSWFTHWPNQEPFGPRRGRSQA